MFGRMSVTSPYKFVGIIRKKIDAESDLDLCFGLDIFYLTISKLQVKKVERYVGVFNYYRHWRVLCIRYLELSTGIQKKSFSN